MISLHKQLEKINQTYNNWSGSVKYRKILLLHGKIRPTAVSPEYDIRISYRKDKMPEVRVLSPQLKIHPDKDSLPHVYQDDRLCLYYKEFDVRKDLLADSIIVWITWWLYYYEIWLQTGKWIARGTHPDRW